MDVVIVVGCRSAEIHSGNPVRTERVIQRSIRVELRQSKVIPKPDAGGRDEDLPIRQQPRRASKVAPANVCGGHTVYPERLIERAIRIKASDSCVRQRSALSGSQNPTVGKDE